MSITSTAHGLRLLADTIDANPDIEKQAVSVYFSAWNEADLARLITLLQPYEVNDKPAATLTAQLAGLRVTILTVPRFIGEESLVASFTPLSIEELRQRAQEQVSA